MKKALLYFFMFLFVVYFVSVGTLFAWQKATGTDHSIYISITAAAIYSAVLLALFLWQRWAVLSPAWLRTRQWAVLFWAAMASVGTIVPSLALGEFLPELDDSMAETFRGLVKSDFGYLVLCIFAPFVEEVVFRGAILRALRQAMRSPWAAIAVSAVLFAAAHGNLAQMPHAFLMGLLLGWMYVRTDSILPGVVLHWANNTVSYAMLLLFPQYEEMTMRQVFGSDLHVALALLCSLCVLLPALFQLNLRMKKQ